MSDRQSELTLQFLGATETVTGSKYLLNHQEKKVLVDCGLFQGLKNLRLRNWASFPLPPQNINAILLTHAHIDHSGYIPLLAKSGFHGKIYCTPSTFELCKILLPDSGHLMEEDARFAERHGFSKHEKPLPLYTREDAERSLQFFRPIPFGEVNSPHKNFSFSFHPAGHILGAAIVKVVAEEKIVVFSGDLGRYNDFIMQDPTSLSVCDYLLVESTYGGKLHDPTDPLDILEGIINKTVKRGGVVLIPAFAVGRTQILLYLIQTLKAANRIPDIPVYVDSPMATNVTHLYQQFSSEHKLTPTQCSNVCGVAKMITSVEDSKALNRNAFPMIIISASGMATGGRILHHLKIYAPDRRNTIVFSGFQAAGTRGEAIVNGAREVKVHGEYIPIEAEVFALHNLSAHADQADLLKWLSHFKSAPKTTFIIHGEPTQADCLRQKITDRLKWKCHIPSYLEKVSLE
jgi:metallo-beta-lactamase family protein